MDPSLSPSVMRIALAFGAFIVIIGTFVGILVILRRELRPKDEGDGNRRASLESAIMLAGYDDVLRKVKEQEKEMERIRRGEKEQVLTASSLTESVLASIKAGMLQFNKMGLIRVADPLARTILGFASPTGMRARDIFRNFTPTQETSAEASGPDFAQQISAAIESSAKEGKEGCSFSTFYKTPGGEQRKILVGIFPM